MHPFSPVSSLELFRCIRCDFSPLASSQTTSTLSAPRLSPNSKVYCTNCGATYPVLNCGAVDFLGKSYHPWQLTPAQAIAHNAPFAWSYERLWRTNALTLLSGEAFPPEREATLLRNLVDLSGPVLDLGAASGLWSRWLLEQTPSATVIALENSAPLLEEAAKRSRPEWQNYSLVRARAEQLPFRDSGFTTVMSGGSLNELSLKETLAEVARVLKPGGSFVSMHIGAVSGWGHPLQQLISQVGMEFYSQSNMKDALSQVGLSVTRYLSFGAIVFLTASPPPIR